LTGGFQLNQSLCESSLVADRAAPLTALPDAEQPELVAQTWALDQTPIPEISISSA